MSCFTYEEWAEEAELSKETITLLRENGFKTIKRCKNLNDKIIQEQFSKLPLGEMLALQEAVAKLSVSGDASSNTVQRPEQPHTATTAPHAAHTQEADPVTATAVTATAVTATAVTATINHSQSVNMAGSRQSANKKGVDRSREFQNGLAAADIPFVVEMVGKVPYLYLRPTPSGQDHKDIKNEIIRNEYGHRPRFSDKEVSILLVGETGTGKTTMVETIVNYALGITSKDNFGVSIVKKQANEIITDEAESQTQWITIYTIYPNRFMDYTLHIIDTPGFGDTRGRGQDEVMVEKMKAFFMHDTMVMAVNAVCFTFKGSATRLTESEKYIVQQITGLFGKDIENNIIVFATFWDKKDPPLKKPLKAGKVTYKQLYCVDSIDPTKRNEDTHRCIDKNTCALKALFDHMPDPTSLQLSGTVLEERSFISNSVINLRTLVSQMLTKLTSHESIIKQIDQHIYAKSEMTTVEVEETFMERKPSVSTNINCLTCERTCGYGWSFKLGFLQAIDKMCDCNDSYRCHIGENFIWSKTEQTVSKTKAELMNAYKTKSIKLQDIKDDIEKKFDTDMSELVKLVEKLKSSTNRLEEIALRPQITDISSVIRGLIEKEQQNSKGNEKRVEFLTRMQECVQPGSQLKTLTSLFAKVKNWWAKPTFWGSSK